MNAPRNAPACFAAASVFAHDSTVCKACPVFAECAEASLKTLEAIRGVINVEDLIRRHAKARMKAINVEEVAAEEREPEPTGPLMQPVETKPVERKTAAVKVSFDVSPDDSALLFKISNVNAREVAYTIVKTHGIEGIKSALREGRNPYAESGPSFLRVTLQMLLEGGFTKGSLRKRMEVELGWGESTAASQVGQAVGILVAFKIAHEKSSVFTLFA